MGLALVNQRLHEHVLGVVLLLFVVCIWVGSSFMIRAILHKEEYHAPFFITYINNSFFTLNLLVNGIGRLAAKRKPVPIFLVDEMNQVQALKEAAAAAKANGDIESKDLCNPNDTNKSLYTEAPTDVERIDECGRPVFSLRKMILHASVFAVLFFSANYTANMSLRYTTVSASTILSTTSGLFTLFIGVLFRTEKLSVCKCLAAVISLAGVIVVAYKNEDTSKESCEGSKKATNALLGNMLALLSALLYGVYTIYLKRHLKHDSHKIVTLFFGFVGILTPIILLPALLGVHFSGFEPISLPSSPRVYGMIVANAAVGTVLSQYLWARAMLLTSPLMCTLGLSLSIPLSATGDIWMESQGVPWQIVVGGLAVLAGFLIINIGVIAVGWEKRIDEFCLGWAKKSKSKR